jgi:hypothetical protein
MIDDNCVSSDQIVQFHSEIGTSILTLGGHVRDFVSFEWADAVCFPEAPTMWFKRISPHLFVVYPQGCSENSDFWWLYGMTIWESGCCDFIEIDSPLKRLSESWA